MSGPGRRNNAPIRPQRNASSLPDLMFAVAAAGLMMAVVFFLASFVDNDVTLGDAGRVLARLFAGALLVSALFAFLLAVVFARDRGARGEHYVFPLAVGIIAGGISASLFLQLRFLWMFLPFLLLILVIRPIRRRVFERGGRARGSQG
ncbi:MAG: hypothetical protein ABI305_05200 [Tepidiformaceae bacterium]